ncbi:MAG: thioredoxin fold domain-containing protein [Candidatus Thiodiazotropha sp.]
MRYLFLLFLAAVFSSQTHASDILQQNDLSRLAAQAKQKRLPILLIVSQHYCPFCVRLKEEIIHPMRISGDYEDKVVITEILLDSDENIRDFKGASVSPGAFADSYRVWVTPTLLFLDHTGREIHKRMLGVNTIEMYSYYLDASLAASLRAVHTGDRGYVLTNDDISGDAPGYDQLY